MEEIDWQQFEVVELRIGTIIEVEDFPEARVPAYKIKADFGSQIGPFRPEFLLTGFCSEDRSLVLAVPERPVADGDKLG